MSDFQSLILIIFALYLMESLVWLPEGAFVYRRSLFGSWHVVRRGWQLSLFHGQIYLAPLLPPFGRLLISGYPPVRITPQGLCLNSSEGNQTDSWEGYIPFPEVFVTGFDGRKLLWNGKTVARFSSPLSARHAAGLLARFRDGNETDRAKLLDADFRRMLDSKRLRERMAACRQAGSLLRAACSAEFALLLIGFPVAGALIGFRALLLPLLFGLLALGIFICWQLHRAYQALHGARHPNRVSVTAMLVLSPIAATRAYDQLAEDAISDFHPLAAASVLFSRETFLAETARYLREWLFPLPGTGAAKSTEHTAAEDWFRDRWQEAVERFVAEHFGDPAEFLSAPPKESEECRSFCPRCCSQYLFEKGQCADCLLPVLRFEEPNSPAALHGR